ncbi:hypothetical protein HYPSUDRAFT_80276 [Hypholoma sublateritium FD-334 SS-4]|uniref:FAD-binding domain-containing protein n=1 Tax=Hypholoma sublateritium (strain FD-334 SS-4) TaxID=945553 RepID=A0A0D2LYQ3_HYPSF|nr:hypothetical protein HYPSUDRAFT_80276 [Hypholoma sublateritium FD-334 SS-4]
MSMNNTVELETAQEPQIRVAIIGAGIGGLALLAALHIFDQNNKLDINLYESAHQITEIGAGIGMWPRTWNIMKELGFDEPLGNFLSSIPDNNEHIAWQLRKADQPEGIHIQNLKINGSILGFHRADVQQTFLQRTNPNSIHVNKRLTSFEETPQEGIHLHFNDGSSAKCDILVGMDGINSVVRKGLLIKQGLSTSASLDPVWTGTIAYRGLIEQAGLEAMFPGHRVLTTPVMYVGKLRHAIAYPVQHEDGKVLVNVAAFVGNPSKENTPYSEAPVSPCTQEEILDAYAGWEPEFQALLQCLSQAKRWPIADLIPLDSYASGQIFIGGDAAHAMPPHQGSGAGQAIEDAYILAKLLSHPKATKVLIPKISEVYNSIRQPRGNRVLAASIRTGLLCEFLAPGFEHVREGDAHVPFDKLHEVAELLSKELEWTWKESAEGDVERALEMFTGGL